jgi:L-alanine-DL-glutamate epimerase-like enolase superfamily enzyme
MHDLSEQWITDRQRCIKADISIVTISTDEGTVGVGEACAYGNPLQIADWVAWYSKSLVGQDVTDFSVVPRPTGTSFEHMVSSAHDYAVAGVDCALWDLRAKLRGLPLSQALNPNADAFVDVYASGGVRYDWRGDPTSLVEDMLGYAEAGYRTVKLRLGTAWDWDDVTAEKFIALFSLVRKELGSDIGIAVDANSRLGRDDAKRVAFGLADNGALFLEEPLAKDDIQGYVDLRSDVPIRISGGESLATREQFRPWIEDGALDIVQPDAGKCGISELLAIGKLAEEHGLELIPHSWHNGLMAMANAHAVAALANSHMVEECMVQGPLKWDVIVGGSPVVGGRVWVNDSPGLGVEVIDDIVERYPYVEGHYSVEVFRK